MSSLILFGRVLISNNQCSYLDNDETGDTYMTSMIIIIGLPIIILIIENGGRG